MNPYLELGVAGNADDSQIRRAYLTALKTATPEANPQRFKALTEAYEKIKNQDSRYRYELFHTESPGDSPLEVFLGHLRLCAKPAPLPFEAMKEFLRSCSKM
jgi:curved DNA-binding protein CbpA